MSKHHAFWLSNSISVAALVAAIGLGSTILASSAAAQSASGKSTMGSSSSMSGMSAMHDTPAMRDYSAAMKRMDQKMMQAMDKDAGKAYIKMMIAHHQGAVDMSEIALRHSNVPYVREAAQKQITMQEKDIAELQSLLAKN